jgi:hypothetical protein
MVEVKMKGLWRALQGGKKRRVGLGYGKQSLHRVEMGHLAQIG